MHSSAHDPLHAPECIYSNRKGFKSKKDAKQANLIRWQKENKQKMVAAITLGRSAKRTREWNLCWPHTKNGVIWCRGPPTNFACKRDGIRVRRQSGNVYVCNFSVTCNWCSPEIEKKRNERESNNVLCCAVGLSLRLPAHFICSLLCNTADKLMPEWEQSFTFNYWLFSIVAGTFFFCGHDLIVRCTDERGSCLQTIYSE